MRVIIYSLFKLLFITVFIAGFLCIFGEIIPWSIKGQIGLFIKGFVLMFIGFFGCAFFEGLEDKKR